MKKRVVLLVAVIAFGVLSCKDNSSTSSKVKNHSTEQNSDLVKGNAEIKFNEEVHDFGTINEGDIVETVFTFENTSKTDDLIISDARASCGCTTPSWTKTPIKPGGMGEITVKFNSNGRPNAFSKTVVLNTNTEKGREIIRIKGFVTPDPAKENEKEKIIESSVNHELKTEKQ